MILLVPYVVYIDADVYDDACVCVTSLQRGERAVCKFRASGSILYYRNDRSKCTTCEEVETLDHILTECPANTRSVIWTAAHNIWPHDEELWPAITPGTILGCGLLEIKTRNQSADQSQEDHSSEPTLNTGATRLAKILISEAAYLVWTMRCGRVIGDRSYSTDAIETAWRKTINRRLSEDVIAATKVVRRDEYTKLISSTWRDALRKQHGALPHF